MSETDILLLELLEDMDEESENWEQVSNETIKKEAHKKHLN